MKAMSFIVVAAVVSLGGVVCAQEVTGFPMPSPNMVTPSSVPQAENPTMVTPSNVNPEAENPTMITPTGQALNPLGGTTIGSFSIPRSSIPSSPIPHTQIHNFSIPAFSLEHDSVPAFAAIPRNPIPHSSIPSFSLANDSTSAAIPAAESNWAQSYTGSNWGQTPAPANPNGPSSGGVRLSH
jgi:hypothetical protein